MSRNNTASSDGTKQVPTNFAVLTKAKLNKSELIPRFVLVVWDHNGAGADIQMGQL